MIPQDFWQSNFWKKCRSLPIIKQVGALYHAGIKAKHLVLSKILCPYYKFAARNQRTQEKDYNFGSLYVSLTTFPARIKESYFAICSILNQSIKPNKILLTLTEEEFPNKENDVPSQILNLREKGLEILWAKENLKPHNKYFYAMQKYPNAIIITADDDILYPRHSIKKLVNSYLENPHAVHGLCTDKLFYNGNTIKPYSQAAYCYDTYIREPHYDLMIQGFAGALYPPSILPKEVFNKEQIKKCAPIADDLWLKGMELLENIPVVCAAKYQDPPMIYSSQATALFKTNNNLFQNDKQLENIISEYRNQGILNHFK